MNQKYFGRISFLDRELLISLNFVFEAKCISQVYQLVQAKYKITEDQILDLRVTNRKALKTHKENSFKQWMEKSFKGRDKNE
ncbi:hypothetical protein ACQV5J_16340 [Leptospira interrogans]|uniref:hypothetical protein n=1 Tax=Leptospira interrogans TaxID=173 RepID=UPI000772DE55|nr:hypothetical protein [Leptospira interrogans]OOB99121.1 hypothetical protein B0192_06955 [Leptospira interrogans serovar Australis]